MNEFSNIQDECSLITSVEGVVFFFFSFSFWSVWGWQYCICTHLTVCSNFSQEYEALVTFKVSHSWPGGVRVKLKGLLLLLHTLGSSATEALIKFSFLCGVPFSLLPFTCLWAGNFKMQYVAEWFPHIYSSFDIYIYTHIYIVFSFCS